MKTKLKIAGNEKIAQAYARVKIGNLWEKGVHKRLYLNDDVLHHLHNSKQISHSVCYSKPYLNIVNGEWGSSAPVSEAEFQELDQALGGLLQEFKEKLNKTSRSKWTGAVSLCTDIYHVLGA